MTHSQADNDIFSLPDFPSRTCDIVVTHIPTLVGTGKELFLFQDLYHESR